MTTFLGALTTTFTPPADCTTPSLRSQPSGTQTSTLTLFDPHLPLGTRCLPPSYTPNGYYSPGVCPSAWQYRAITINAANPSETIINCCPHGFWVDDFDDQNGRPANTPRFTRCSVGTLMYSGEPVVLYAPGQEVTTALQRNVQWGVEASPVQVRFRDGDGFPGQGQTAAVWPPTPQGYFDSVTRALESTSAPVPSSQSDDTSALSVSLDKAVIPLVTVAGLVILCLILCCVMCCCRRRRRRFRERSAAARRAREAAGRQLAGGIPDDTQEDSRSSEEDAGPPPYRAETGTELVMRTRERAGSHPPPYEPPSPLGAVVETR